MSQRTRALPDILTLEAACEPIRNALLPFRFRICLITPVISINKVLRSFHGGHLNFYGVLCDRSLSLSLNPVDMKWTQVLAFLAALLLFAFVTGNLVVSSRYHMNRECSVSVPEVGIHVLRIHKSSRT